MRVLVADPHRLVLWRGDELDFLALGFEGDAVLGLQGHLALLIRVVPSFWESSGPLSP
jgi:hypothetical protein